MIDAMRLVDHHVHGVLTSSPTDLELCGMLSESHTRPGTVGQSFRSPLGISIRRWCAPLLDLPTSCSAQAYLDRRAELGNRRVNEILLKAAGVDVFLVDSGHGTSQVSSPQALAASSGSEAIEVLRLESLLEQVAASGIDAAGFGDEFRFRLEAALPSIAGLKSIVAYRYGLDFDPAHPTDGEVTAAASRWLSEIAATGAVRVTDPVLLRFAIWTGIETRLPLQLHIGFGDSDLDMRRCNPLLLTDFFEALRNTDAKVMLLHCYPFHREAGYLAHVYPAAYMDVGLAINHLGPSSHTVIAESMELAPFDKILYSSDAWGPAELHYLGARLWRNGTVGVLRRWLAQGDCSIADAEDIAVSIGRSNALSAYGLDRTR